MLVEMAVDEGIKHELRVATVITYLCLIGETVAFLGQVQMDGVDTGTVVVQRIEMARAVDACLWRHIQVYQQILEINLLGFQQIGNGVVSLAFHMQFHRGQQAFDGLLVYHPVFILGYH